MCIEIGREMRNLIIFASKIQEEQGKTTGKSEIMMVSAKLGSICEPKVR